MGTPGSPVFENYITTSNGGQGKNGKNANRCHSCANLADVLLPFCNLSYKTFFDQRCNQKSAYRRMSLCDYVLSRISVIMG